MEAFRHLTPEKIWHFFGEITRIPRPSKHEEQMIKYLEKFAETRKLKYKTDPAGNVMIFKPAPEGFEHKPVVILQSHIDMVCEKNSGTNHQFLTDPIRPYVHGDWVKAENTTLGADDGIGVAAMLAILDDPHVQHGPLECLFTVDEETGLTGAFELAPDVLTGKMLINLDSEDEGELFIGCAGGKDTVVNFKFTPQPVHPSSVNAYALSITGLRGGHSGDDIHRGYGNAIKLLAEIINDLMSRFEVTLQKIEGGNLRNAIPREAFATVLVEKKTDVAFRDFVATRSAELTKNWAEVEPEIRLDINAAPIPGNAPDTKFQHELIGALLECPNGVIAWSREIPGLVETSTNLASVKFITGDVVEICTSQRSSSDAAKDEIATRVAGVFASKGAQVTHSKGYPGWKPDMNSLLLKITENAYRELFQEAPMVKAIHAGLECGLFLEKYPGLDMISFGPTIKGAHSPDERLDIASVKKFWDLLLLVLKTI